MSYATNIAKDNEKKLSLVRVTPRKRGTGWTLHSGSVYKIAFSFGTVTNVAVTGTDLTEGGSASLSAGQWYHDVDAGYLYVRKSDSTAPDDTTSGDWIIVHFELYFASEDVVWYRDPLDNTTDFVNWRGMIQQPPEVNHSTRLAAFGFIPASSTSVDLTCDPEYLQELIYDTSFRNVPVAIYHVAGDLEVANIEAKMVGLGGKLSYSDTRLTMEIIDQSLRFEKPLVLPTNHRFERASFTSLEADFENKPVPIFYGKYLWHRLIPIKFLATSPAVTDNRDYVICSSEAHTSVNGTRQAGTIPYYNSNGELFMSAADAKLLEDGDTIWIHNGSYGSNVVTTLSSAPAYDSGSGYWRATVSPSVDTSTGRTVEKPVVPAVKLIKNYRDPDNDQAYDLTPVTHFSMQSFANGTIGIRLIDNVEASLGCTVFNPDNDIVIATVDGGLPIPEIGGSPVTSHVAGWQENPVWILYDILTRFCGFAEAEIDTATFETLAALTLPRVSVPFPHDVGGEYPKASEVISRLLNSMFMKAWFDGEGVFTMSQVGALGTSAAEFDDADIEEGSFQLEMDYEDVSQVRLALAPVGYTKISSKQAVLAGTTATDFKLIEPRIPQMTLVSEAAQYLHETTREVELSTYLKSTNASTSITPATDSTFQTRIKRLLGERAARLTIAVPASAIQREVNDTVTVTREKLPGFAFAEGTEQSRDMAIVDVRKASGGVTLILDDQKAIVDNPGDW